MPFSLRKLFFLILQSSSVLTIVHVLRNIYSML